jgi:hypothetical protein
MTDYIFTGETLDGEIVEGDLVHDGQDKTYILMDVMDHIKRDDYAVYMVEVHPSSVRLKSVPLRVAVESIAEYCNGNNHCTIKCKMYETCVNYIQNPDFPRFWQWLDGLAG